MGILILPIAEPRVEVQCRLDMQRSSLLPSFESSLLSLPLESLLLPARTILKSEWKYNNSASNPRNPFVPSQLVDLARRTGIANVILHVAPVDATESELLSNWNLALILKRQRAPIE